MRLVDKQLHRREAHRTQTDSLHIYTDIQAVEGTVKGMMEAVQALAHFVLHWVRRWWQLEFGLWLVSV